MHHLITIPFSHYCEKVRWALDYTETTFSETARMPVFHMAETLPRGGRSVPILVCDNGPVLRDSTDILYWLHRQSPGFNLYPGDGERLKQVQEIEALCNDRLGPAIRMAAYSVLLANFGSSRTFFAKQGSAFDQTAFKLVWPLWYKLLVKTFRPSQHNFEKYSQRVLDIFDQVEALRTPNATFLCGEHLTGADITFAALAVPGLATAEYKHGLMPIECYPQQWQDFTQECIEHPMGVYARWLYANHRR